MENSKEFNINNLSFYLQAKIDFFVRQCKPINGFCFRDGDCCRGLECDDNRCEFDWFDALDDIQSMNDKPASDAQPTAEMAVKSD